MRLSTFHRLLSCVFAALLLSACHSKDDSLSAGGSTPDIALRDTIGLLKAGDFNALWKHALPPADYNTLRADWSWRQRDQSWVDAKERAKFDETMSKLTEPDAETRLYVEIQPQLANMEQRYEDQIPILISIGQAMAKHRIEQNPNLSTGQKTQVSGILDVMGPWLHRTNWFDPAKTRQAVDVAVSTARKLNLKTYDQLRSLDFDNAMNRGSMAFAGAKRLLAIYGLSVDDTLNSVRLTLVSNSDGHAVVKVDYVLLGTPVSTESKMVQQDGRWYVEDLLENVRRSHRELAAEATQNRGAVPVVAGTPAVKD